MDAGCAQKFSAVSVMSLQLFACDREARPALHSVNQTKRSDELKMLRLCSGVTLIEGTVCRYVSIRNSVTAIFMG
jgi:hypothetical protein